MLHLQGTRLAPLGCLAWLGVSFGLLCFCEEMGAGKPLNRAGLVLLAATFCADTLAMLSADPGALARSHLFYAFAVLGALVFWSIALMHRTRAAKAAGQFGAMVGVAALVTLIAAHLLVGTATVLGFSQLFTALDDPARSAPGALALIDALLCGWCLMASALLWKVRLRS